MNERLVCSRGRFSCRLALFQCSPDVAGNLRGFHQLVRLLSVRDRENLAQTRTNRLGRCIVFAVTEINRVDAVAQDFENGVDGALVHTLVLADDESETHAVECTRTVPPIRTQERNLFELVLGRTNDMLLVEDDNLASLVPILQNLQLLAERVRRNLDVVFLSVMYNAFDVGRLFRFESRRVCSRLLPEGFQ